MRILSVVDGIGWGGTKEQVYLLARELSKTAIETHMALSFEYTQMVEKLKEYGIKFHFFEHHHKLSRYSPANYYRLWKIIKENAFHVVLANSPHAFDYVRLVYPFLHKKPKLVVVKRSARVPNRISLKFKYAYADMVVAVSPAVKENLVRAGFPEQKVCVIESGIDTQRFRPDPLLGTQMREKLRIPLDAKVFINVANWNPKVKAQDRLIETFSKLSCRNCYLILVGIDTDHYAPKLAEKHGVKDRVLALGFREDVEALLNASDFFVLSSYLEGVSNALLQAMACGKVVISTKAGGIGQVIKYGENGFLVNVGDFDHLLKKMQRAIELSNEEIKKLSTLAVKTAEQFSISITADKYQDLFKRFFP